MPLGACQRHSDVEETPDQIRLCVVGDQSKDWLGSPYLRIETATSASRIARRHQPDEPCEIGGRQFDCAASCLVSSVSSKIGKENWKGPWPTLIPTPRTGSKRATHPWLGVVARRVQLMSFRGISRRLSVRLRRRLGLFGGCRCSTPRAIRLVGLKLAQLSLLAASGNDFGGVKA